MASISTAAKNAAIDAVAAFADIPGGSGTVPFLAWRQGATFLAFTRIASAAPTWNAASGGLASLVVAPHAMQTFGTPVSGTIDNVVMFNGNGNNVIQSITVGAPGSGAELEVTGSLVYAAGQQFRIDQLDLFIT